VLSLVVLWIGWSLLWMKNEWFCRNSWCWTWLKIFTSWCFRQKWTEISGRRSVWVGVSGCSTDAAAITKYPAIEGNTPLVLIPLISASSTFALGWVLPKIFATSKWLKGVFDAGGNIAVLRCRIVSEVQWKTCPRAVISALSGKVNAVVTIFLRADPIIFSFLVWELYH
jgi:hypothetical protein